MVDEDTVKVARKEGNDGADKGAGKGAVEEQQDLSDAARKYASRQWRYKQLIARMHLYIIHLWKATKGETEALQKQMNPFDDKEQKKQLIPDRLTYADAKGPRGTENISTQRIEEHGEADPEERGKAETVRCFIDNVRWGDTREAPSIGSSALLLEAPPSLHEAPHLRGGITWIELYIYFILHGAGRTLRRAKTNPP